MVYRSRGCLIPSTVHVQIQAPPMYAFPCRDSSRKFVRFVREASKGCDSFMVSLARLGEKGTAWRAAKKKTRGQRGTRPSPHQLGGRPFGGSGDRFLEGPERSMRPGHGAVELGQGDKHAVHLLALGACRGDAE